MNKLFFPVVLLLSFASLFAPTAHAQTGPGATGPAPSADPTAVPIDGGASLLLASGVAYGLRRLQQRRRRS